MNSLMFAVSLFATLTSAVSPNGRNEIRLYTEPLSIEVARDGEVVIARSEVGLKVDGKWLKAEGDSSLKTAKCEGTLATPVYKKASISLAANETAAEFGDWTLRLIARDDGVAYRFETAKKGEIVVDDERADLRIADRNSDCLTYYTKKFGCEEVDGKLQKAGEIKTDEDYVYLPLLVRASKTVMTITEADLQDYPILNFIRPSSVGEVKLTSAFSKYPLAVSNEFKEPRTEGAKRKRKWSVTHTFDYLVKGEGTRVFPWRLFMFADSEAQLCENDAVYALSRPATNDFSWVKPGKVAWDWWNAFDNKGDPVGCTTETYVRFIDFAAANGVEYVIFDEGWSKKLDIWNYSPVVDVPYLIDYANKRGVGIILWMAWAQIDGDEARVAETFAKLGVKGFKVDFMDRGDAAVERFLWKFAEECAKYKLVIDWHGAHRPTGQHRAYPNVLNYEGIMGLEFMKWYDGSYSMANHDVTSFFGRLTVGPMDYTPGAMDNYTRKTIPVVKAGDTVHLTPTYYNPGSVTTRTHQMALSVLYEAPLQMLADSPTKYEREKECFSFMAKTPVVWANTIGLGGSLTTYAAVARQAKDGSWYVGVITGDDPAELAFDTSFLGAGEWQVEAFADGEEAGEKPMQYLHTTTKLQGGEKLKVKLAPCGGYVAHLTR